MPAGSHQFSVGAIRCTVLSDGYASYPTPWVFPDADPEQLAQSLDCRRLPHETVLTPYACMLVETGRHTILVDTGLGAASSTSGAIEARLEVAGIRRKDVDTVVLTHAHPDHIGGSIDLSDPLAPRPAFPNARYVISERELEFWNLAHPDLRGMRLPQDVKQSIQTTAQLSLAALRHNLDPIDRDREVTPGVRAIPAPGHTPGHLALLLESEGVQLLNLGDAAVHPVNLEHPDWEVGFDVEPDRAVATRRTLLERAAAEKMIVMAFHFPFPSVGRLAGRAGGGWDWTLCG